MSYPYDSPAQVMNQVLGAVSSLPSELGECTDNRCSKGARCRQLDGEWVLLCEGHFYERATRRPEPPPPPRGDWKSTLRKGYVTDEAPANPKPPSGGSAVVPPKPEFPPNRVLKESEGG